MLKWTTACSHRGSRQMFDVIVIGGGPAGLSAALMLGAAGGMCCSAMRDNPGTADRWHFMAISPGMALSRRTSMISVGRSCAGTGWSSVALPPRGSTSSRKVFAYRLADGRIERSRFLLIATGVVDKLPELPGFDECYGRSVFHCPYCDGWEWRDRPLAGLRPGPIGGGAWPSGSGPGAATSSSVLTVRRSTEPPRTADPQRHRRSGRNASPSWCTKRESFPQCAS